MKQDDPSGITSTTPSIVQIDPALAKAGGASLNTAEGTATEAKPAEVKPEKKQYPTPDQIQPDPLAQKRKKEEVNTVRVSMDKMGKLTGHYFIITLKTGNEQRGLLRKVDDTKLYLDRKLYGGKFEYRIRKDQVKSLQMLKHVPEER